MVESTTNKYNIRWLKSELQGYKHDRSNTSSLFWNIFGF